LGAFGHLVLINGATYQYIHVHPMVSRAAEGGPDVTFMPVASYGPITSGTYRVFGQFSRHDALFVADFTIRVQ
jgi:hypothetical protein